MAYLKGSRVTGLSPKPLDVKGFTQSASEDLEGKYSQHEVLLADAFNVTDDVTISDNLILTKLSDDGNAITVTGDATTTRTISGSGSLEGSTFAQTPNASMTGMTGVVGSAVTGGAGLTGSTSLGTVTAGTLGTGVTGGGGLTDGSSLTSLGTVTEGTLGGISVINTSGAITTNGRIRGVASVGQIGLTQHYTMTQSGTYTVPFGQLRKGDSADFAFDSTNKGLLIKKTGWYILTLTENWDTASVNGRLDITFVAVGQTNPGNTIFNTDSTTYDQKNCMAAYEVTSPNTIIYVTYSTGYTVSNFYHGCGLLTAYRLN
jgi:hypothetical protein